MVYKNKLEMNLSNDYNSSIDISEQLISYIRKYEKIFEEFRDFRHNALNIMHGINGYIELEDWEGLKKFFYEMLETIKPIHTTLSEIEKIKNVLLKGLLSTKLEKAVRLAIDFKLMIDQGILPENELINDNDLFQLIDVFLDKAIDMASEANIKKVSIYFLRNGNFTTIIIENTFKEKPKINGMSSMLQYPNVLYNTFVQHQVFVQEVQIKDVVVSRC